MAAKQQDLANSRASKCDVRSSGCVIDRTHNTRSVYIWGCGLALSTFQKQGEANYSVSCLSFPLWFLQKQNKVFLRKR